MSDLHIALRSLAKTPRFPLAALLILAVGIAGNTVVFSRVNGLFLKPLPFPHSAQLVDLNVSPLDPLVLLGTMALLGTIVLAACLVSARRATRLNLLDVLRAD